MGVIKSLNEFETKETFIRLLDRAVYVENQIDQNEKLLKLDTTVINTLEGSGIDFMNLRWTFIESIYISYRSMFQASYWEDHTRKSSICKSAYGYDEEHGLIHDKIIEHVNKALAHQDFQSKTRGIYPPIMNEENEECHLVYRQIEHHGYMILPLIKLMKKTIKDVYYSKFGIKKIMVVLEKPRTLG